MSEDTNTPQAMPEEPTSAGFTPLRGLLGLLWRHKLRLVAASLALIVTSMLQLSLASREHRKHLLKHLPVPLGNTTPRLSNIPNCSKGNVRKYECVNAIMGTVTTDKDLLDNSHHDVKDIAKLL